MADNNNMKRESRRDYHGRRSRGNHLWMQISKWIFLIVLLVLTVVALYYYLKLITPMFIKCDENAGVKLLEAVYSQKFVLIFCTILTVLIGIYPEKLIELCRFIAYSI